MYDKILVPVDFTAKNDAALASAVEIAGGSPAGRGEITLLHAIETIEHLEPGEMEEFYRGLETRATAKLRVLVEGLTPRFPRVHCEIRIGKRAETVVRYAEEGGFDLIVLSSHLVDPEHPALGWGTISYKIAIVARCPVLLVK
jgi:nucleotide-binding universal stress UspA family protein